MQIKKIYDKRKIKKPEISVLISYLNNEDTIKKSLESVLKQTYKKFEIIIFSDGSTDKSDSIVMNLLQKTDNILFIKSNKNYGLTKALNFMVKFSKGKYIARHDTDDISDKKRFELQLNHLKTHRNIDLLGSNCIHKIKNKKKFIKMPTNNLSIKKILPRRNPLTHSSIIMTRKVLDKYKYDQSFRRCQDYELWLRLRNKVRFHNLQKYLIIRQVDQAKFSAKDLFYTCHARLKNLNFFQFLAFGLKDIIYFFLRKILI